MAVCNKTGSIAIYNESKNLFLSPYSDGPIKFHTNPDGTMNVKNISVFGRSFSLVRIPYSFKLLIQELQVMNISMRIITDANVDQLLSMSYSNNINKLLRTTWSNTLLNNMLHFPDGDTRNIEDTQTLITAYVNRINKTIDQTNNNEIMNKNKPKENTPSLDISVQSAFSSPEYVKFDTPSSFTPPLDTKIIPPPFSPHSPDESPPQIIPPPFSPHSPDEPPPQKIVPLEVVPLEKGNNSSGILDVDKETSSETNKEPDIEKSKETETKTIDIEQK